MSTPGIDHLLAPIENHDGKMVLQIIQEKNVTKKECAKLLGVSKTTFYRLLESRSWTAKNLYVLGLYLEVNLLAPYEDKVSPGEGFLLLPDGRHEVHLDIISVKRGGRSEDE